MRWILGCVLACALNSWAQMGMDLGLGMRFLQLDLSTKMQKELDSNYADFRAVALRDAPNVPVSLVGFQGTRMSFPLQLQTWWAWGDYLRLNLGLEAWQYSDHALFVQGDWVTQKSYSLAAIEATPKIALILPRTILTMDSARSLRIELGRVWNLWSGFRWADHWTDADFSWRGQGYQIGLAYENRTWKGLGVGLDLGYASSQSLSAKRLGDVLTRSNPAGSLSWTTSGPYFRLRVQWSPGAQTPDSVPSSALPKDSVPEIRTVDSLPKGESLGSVRP
jgi:hypothetical protein